MRKSSIAKLFHQKFLLTALALPMTCASAAEWIVNSADDTGANGTLRWALAQAQSGDVINIELSPSSPINLTSDLPAINHSISINSPNNAQTIDGGSQYRIFATNLASLSVNNINIVNGLAQGGAGAPSEFFLSGGGGGGLGAGGGVFVDIAQTVTLSNTSISNSKAVGGGGRWCWHWWR